MAKLNLEKAEDIRKMVKAGVSRVEIAMHYKVSVDTVNKITQGRLWLHTERGTLTADEFYQPKVDASGEKLRDMLAKPETPTEQKEAPPKPIAIDADFIKARNERLEKLMVKPVSAGPTPCGGSELQTPELQTPDDAPHESAHDDAPFIPPDLDCHPDALIGPPEL